MSKEHERSQASRPRVLLTLTDVPHPANRGKRMRQAALLHGLAAVADVDVALVLPREAGPDLSVPARLGARRWMGAPVPLRPRRSALLRVASRLFPWQIACRNYEEARHALTSWRDRRTTWSCSAP